MLFQVLNLPDFLEIVRKNYGTQQQNKRVNVQETDDLLIFFVCVQQDFDYVFVTPKKNLPEAVKMNLIGNARPVVMIDQVRIEHLIENARLTRPALESDS